MRRGTYCELKSDQGYSDYHKMERLYMRNKKGFYGIGYICIAHGLATIKVLDS